VNLPAVDLAGEPVVEVRRLAYADPFRISRTSVDEGFTTSVFVTLHDCEGRTGLGEAAPEAYYGETAATVLAAFEAYRELLVAGDAASFSAAAPGRLNRNPAARAALETALLDLQGQAAGVPLNEVLGSNPGAAPATDFSVGLDEPDVVAERVRRAAASGFGIVKLKLGGDQDVETLRAVRAAFDGTLRVDANAGWRSVDHAIRMSRLCAEHDVEFIEQPMPRHALRDLARLQAASPLPIVADESAETIDDLPNLVGVVAGVNVKLMKCGGPLEAAAMIRAARDLGLRVMIGCMVETSIAITAMAHLAGLADWVDLDGNLLLAEDPYRGVQVGDGGKLELPQRPGLGVVAG
jgi:L-alanine-DL-glutamate epimerase-like enolase superfamily enzyme